MSNNVHVHTPNMGHPDYKGTHYTPQVNSQEGHLAGKLIGMLISFFYIFAVKFTMESGATVLDVLRMKAGTADFFEWRRIAALWLGLLGYLCLGSGVVGYGVVWLFTCALVFVPGGVFVLQGLFLLPLPVMNGLYSLLVPTMWLRTELLRGNPVTAEKGMVLGILKDVQFASIPLVEWWTAVDLASMLIPVALTVAATVKYSKLSKSRNFVGGEECVGRPFTPAEKGLIGFAILLLVLGLPGAPVGLWALISLLGWKIFGKTKRVGNLSQEALPVTSTVSFDPTAATMPAPPASLRPAATPSLDTLDFTTPLRAFEQSELKPKNQQPPSRLSDYAE